MRKNKSSLDGMKIKKNKNNLDERQEQALLRIEHNGCWLAFWGLLAVIALQSVILNFDTRSLAGEYLVFMILALYISVGCLRQGIWDRRLKPDTSSNAAVSLTAAFIAGILNFICTAKRFPDKIPASLAVGFVYAAIAFTVCFAALQLAANLLKKRQASLEKEPPESEFSEDEKS